MISKNKHTIKQKDWWDYPGIKRWKTPFRYEDKFSHVVVKIGIQDGIPVHGCDYGVTGHLLGNGSSGCNPHRKWGEFRSTRDAELFTLEMILENFKDRIKLNKNIKPRVSKAIKAMRARIVILRRREQFELFP